MSLLYEYVRVEGRTVQLVQFKGRLFVLPHYKVSFFVSVEGEGAAPVSGQV